MGEQPPPLRTELALDAVGTGPMGTQTQTRTGWSITPTTQGQYLSIRYTNRLTEAEIAPSVGSAGDSYRRSKTHSSTSLPLVKEREAPGGSLPLGLGTLKERYISGSAAWVTSSVSMSKMLARSLSVE